MKSFFSSKKIVILSLVILTFTSCGTYQSVYNNDDGIYDTNKRPAVVERIVIVEKSEKKYRKTEDNYFTKELDRVREANIYTNDSTAFRDSDYTQREIDSINYNTRITYNDEDPWEYEDNNNVINYVILGHNNLGFWDNYYGFGNHWRYRWGFRHGFFGDYLHMPFYSGFYQNFGPYGFNFFSPFNFYSPYRYNNYRNNRNYNYGKRNYTNSNYNRRYSSTNGRRTTSGRRSYNSNIRNSSTTRRSSSNRSYNVNSPTRRRSSSTRSSNSSRKKTYTPTKRRSSSRSSSSSRRSSGSTKSYRSSSSRSSSSRGSSSRRRN